MKLEVHVHVHHHGATDDELRDVRSTLVEMKGILMTTAQQFEAGFQRLNTATTAVANLIRDLIAKQQSGGMTEEEEAAAHTKLLAAADALEAMATTPADPVPTPVPPGDDEDDADETGG